MKRLAAATGFVLACGLVYPLAAQQPTAFTPDTTTEHKATVQKYCVTCHNERTKSGGLALENMDYANVAAGAAVLEKSIKKLKVAMMPLHGAPQPDAATRAPPSPRLPCPP